MPFSVIRNDITRVSADAIVNPANSSLLAGGGACGMIFAAAGERELQAACDAIGHCGTGSAVATPAFRLSEHGVKHVIHAVGPVWQGGEHDEERLLFSAYGNALTLAWELGDRSIAFPLISAGVYGYPAQAAIEVAVSAIRAFLDWDEHADMEVTLVLFAPGARAVASGLFDSIAEYIDDAYVEQHAPSGASRLSWDAGAAIDFASVDAAHSVPVALPDAALEPRTFAEEEEQPHLVGAAPDSATEACAPAMAPSAAPEPHGLGQRIKHGMVSFGKSRTSDLEKLFKHMDAGFSDTLLAMIDERGLKDADVYKRANISRQHFSKIRNNPSYQPKKQTVLALAIALELSLDDTKRLLERAGFALTSSVKRDVIVKYFIEQGRYDIYEINLALYSFDEPLLG